MALVNPSAAASPLAAVLPGPARHGRGGAQFAAELQRQDGGEGAPGLPARTPAGPGSGPSATDTPTSARHQTADKAAPGGGTTASTKASGDGRDAAAGDDTEALPDQGEPRATGPAGRGRPAHRGSHGRGGEAALQVGTTPAEPALPGTERADGPAEADGPRRPRRAARIEAEPTEPLAPPAGSTLALASAPAVPTSPQGAGAAAGQAPGADAPVAAPRSAPAREPLEPTGRPDPRARTTRTAGGAEHAAWPATTAAAAAVPASGTPGTAPGPHAPDAAAADLSAALAGHADLPPGAAAVVGRPADPAAALAATGLAGASPLSARPSGRPADEAGNRATGAARGTATAGRGERAPLAERAEAGRRSGLAEGREAGRGDATGAEGPGFGPLLQSATPGLAPAAGQAGTSAAAAHTSASQVAVLNPLAAAAQATGPGPAPAGTAPMAPAAMLHLPVPLDDPGFGAALGTRVSLLARDGLQEAQLTLNPPEMGPVTVQIRVEGSAARVNFQAEVAATRDAISASLPALAGALQEAGLTLSGGGVSQHMPQGQPGHGQQPQGQGAQGGSARPSGERGGAEAGPTTPGVALAQTARRGLVDLVA